MPGRQHPFDLLMQLDTDHIKLDCATLHLARDVFPHLELGRYLDQLDSLADEVAAQRPGLEATARYEAMREVLVKRHGFTGNDSDFYDPENSYINRVLERRIGVPISLSVIWLEIGRRLKWPITGVGFPKHFLIRFDDPDRFVIADPFNDARSMSIEDCRELLRETRDLLDEEPRKPLKLRPEHLASIDTRAILVRMLNNLRRIYLINNDWKKLAPVLYRLAAAEPENGRHLCELASLHARMGDMKSAYAHLAVYLKRIPQGEETPIVRDSLHRLRAAITALN